MTNNNTRRGKEEGRREQRGKEREGVGRRECERERERKNSCVRNGPGLWYVICTQCQCKHIIPIPCTYIPMINKDTYRYR